MSLPTIDVSPIFAQDAFSAPYSSELLSLVRQVDDASRTWGFFNIVNHGLTQDLFDEVEAASKVLFASDSHIKEACAKKDSATSRGFFDKEYTKNIIDWKEGFDFGFWTEDPDNHKELWPEIAGFKETMHKYFFAVDEVARLLTKVTALALGQHPDHFLSSFSESKHPIIIRLNYYPVSTSDRQVLGVNPHQDGGALTLLKQDDNVSGLQIYKGVAEEFNADDEENWMTVQPVKGAIVVNVGMMLEVWSNKRYKAALHRVVANNSQPRYSAPFFLFPSYEATVSPILTPEFPQPQYRDIQYGEFRRLLYEGFQREIPLDQQARLPNYRIKHEAN